MEILRTADRCWEFDPVTREVVEYVDGYSGNTRASVNRAAVASEAEAFRFAKRASWTATDPDGKKRDYAVPSFVDSLSVDEFTAVVAWRGAVEAGEQAQAELLTDGSLHEKADFARTYHALRRDLEPSMRRLRADVRAGRSSIPAGGGRSAHFEEAVVYVARCAAQRKLASMAAAFEIVYHHSIKGYSGAGCTALLLVFVPPLLWLVIPLLS